ncbi:MAG: glycogen-binding domain-containing protein [Bacteroidetes bacterium]|nr:glycogen-binding domain-containing protein [Bacteroidota bacterium]
MRTRGAWILVLILLVTALDAHAQFDPKKVCRIVDGHMSFTLDTRWNAAQRKEITRMFALDSALLANAFALKPLIRDSSNVWKTRKIDANHIELSVVPGKTAVKDGSKDKIFLLDDKWINYESGYEMESVPYGVNRLTRNSIIQLSGNRLRFFLPGQKSAKKVYLSGTFNAWSTLQTPMVPCDSGWNVTITLRPGKYAYKYIIDGKWSNDSYNKLREDDKNAGYNNIFYCYNHKFVLNGYPNARNVVVSASFNDWNPKELRMIRFQGSWILSMYLREGTHAYKFVVDGEWITDPANKVTRPDGKGNLNSFLGIGDTLFFTLKGYPNAGKVVVSGNFNAWNHEELGMNKTRGGWQLPYVLAAGNYEYKFIVDGTWITDPNNPYTVGLGDITNSYLAVKPNYWFRLDQHSDADKVIVTGIFNNWNTQDYRMELRQGTWWFPISLRPGKYTYKFIVDNKWILDPANPLWEDNEYGTGNSVLWIEP